MQKLTFKTTTRGPGKVFTLIGNVPDRTMTWDIHAHTSEVDDLPCKVVKTAAGCFVLVAPILESTLKVDLQAKSADGTVLARGVHTIRPTWAMLQSKMNTALHNETAEAIRNADFGLLPDILCIGDISLTSTGVPDDILGFTVVYPPDDKSPNPLQDLEVRILGLDGKPANTSEPILMGSSRYEHENYPHVLCSRARFSIRIPAELTSVIIWVRHRSDNIADGFECLYRAGTANLRIGWQKLSRPAELSDPKDYEKWFCAHKSTEDDLAIQRVAQKHFPVRPLFSIIVPLYHTPLDFLHEMAESVLTQTYDNFELILVNSTPQDADLAAAVASLAKQDHRIRIVALEDNLGITENTNAGIDVAKGDFLSFFDHDDILEPDILYWYVKGINDHPDTDLLYCDEDKLENGQLSYPFFKPDWDQLFLETNNYICHLLTVRKSIVDELPRPTKELDGAQDHSMALSVGERARNVYHARRVLYHWRIHSQSTAANANAKPESLEAGRVAIERHLKRCNVDGRVENMPGMPHCYRPAANVDTQAKVLLLQYGTKQQLADAKCDPVASTAWKNLSVRSVPTNGAFSSFADRTNSLVGENPDCSYVAFLSAECKPQDPSWLARLLELAQRDFIAAVAPKVTFPDGTVRNLGVVCSQFGIVCDEHRFLPPNNIGSRGLAVLPHQVSAVRGTCLVVDKQAFDMVGGLSTKCSKYSWDIDLCLALRSHGYGIAVEPSALANAPLEFESLTECPGDILCARRLGQAQVLHRWPKAFSDADPFYNPNMNQDGYYGLPR